MWEAQYDKHDSPRSLITSGGLGTMGFALPAAIGAKMARPEAEVWVVVGDGGFQMTMCELATAMQEGLDINIAIINNGYLGMVRQWQEFFYDKRYAATPITGPDFVKLAEAFGAFGRAVDKRGGVEDAVQAARRHHGVSLIDFRVEQEDSVYPMVPAGADLHKMIRRPSHQLWRRQRTKTRILHKATKATEQHDFGKGLLRVLRGLCGSCRLRICFMIHTFAVYVDNKPGVLNRVASLFRRRAFNIESLTVGRTEQAGISRMTVVVDTDEYGARRLEANLYKLVPVRRVENITQRPTIARDLALIKVSAAGDVRAQVMQLVEVYRARVIDVSADSLVIEATGTEDKIDSLLEVVRPYGVVEMVRTGLVAMARGTGAAVQRPVEAVPAGHDNLGDYSV